MAITRMTIRQLEHLRKLILFYLLLKNRAFDRTIKMQLKPYSKEYVGN